MIAGIGYIGQIMLFNFIKNASEQYRMGEQ